MTSAKSMPKVSIGIPTYNREKLLIRAIESALNQDYENIEVIVFDNASTDETKNVCQIYCNADTRFQYFSHSSNRGPEVNFESVLEKSSGQFFMWLGDDDWIDGNYVSLCANDLIQDPSFSLVSGAPKYYRNGQKSHQGKIFNLLRDVWWCRVISYYGHVADNGMFYGLMRSSQIKKIRMPNVMGGDWHLIANIVCMGKTKFIRETSVHRELGGATTSYKQIAATLGISKIHAIFPMISIAIGAWKDVARNGVAYGRYPGVQRYAVACAASAVILARGGAIRVRIFGSSLKRIFVS